MVSKNKKTIIQIVIIIVMLVSAGIVVSNSFLKEKNQSPSITSPTPNLNEISDNVFEEAIRVFDKEAFQGLIKFGDWPLQVIDKGRPNPFLKI